jgi:hypothetical protein
MSVGEQIILRCTHAQSLSGFSQSAYKQALKELSADAEEYSGCAALIRQAELAAAAHRSASTSGLPVALVATPGELNAIKHAESSGPGQVNVGGEAVTPGVVHANIASEFSTLPAPLLAVLALMLACLLALAVSYTRGRLRARRDG